MEERLDIDNMFTHAAFEIILGDIDFTNVRIYRVPGGKWKYLLFDVEACWRNLEKTPIGILYQAGEREVRDSGMNR